MSIVNGISRIGFMKGGGKALWKDENIADSITTCLLYTSLMPFVFPV